MLKKFTIVTMYTEDDDEIFIDGFVEMMDLSECDTFVEILGEISEKDTVDIEVEYCYLLDKPYIDGTVLTGKDLAIDANDEDIDNIMDNFDELLDQDYIYCEKVLNFSLNGLYEEEVVEEIYDLDKEENSNVKE